jgi:hypothetical protein
MGKFTPAKLSRHIQFESSLNVVPATIVSIETNYFLQKRYQKAYYLLGFPTSKQYCLYQCPDCGITQFVWRGCDVSAAQ